MVGMAFMAAHASACLPPLNCFTCVSWHSPHVAGVGIFTLATSLVLWCPSPWQSSHPTCTSQCRLMLQSATMLRLIFWWHWMQMLVVATAARNGAVLGNAATRAPQDRRSVRFLSFVLRSMLLICSGVKLFHGFRG